MKRIIGIGTVLLCSVFGVQAQSSQAVLSDLMEQALADNKEHKYQSALENFDRVCAQTEMMRTEAERDMYLWSLKMSMSCCLNLKDYVRAWNYCQKLEAVSLSDQEKMELAEQMVCAGLLYVQHMSSKENADFLALHHVLDQITPYAVETEVPSITVLRLLLWYLMAEKYMQEQKPSVAYECLLRAYDGYSDVQGQGLQANVLRTIRECEQRVISLIEKNLSKDQLTNLDFLARILQSAVEMDSTSRNYEILSSYRFIARQTRGMTDETGRQVYHTALFRIARCYIKMDRLKEAWDLGHRLLEQPITEEERKVVVGWVLQVGKRLAIDKMNSVFSVKPDFPGACYYLESVLPFAAGEEKQEIYELIGDTWFQRGASDFLSQKHDHAVACYQKAISFYEMANSKHMALALLYLAKVKICSGFFPEAAELLSRSYQLAAKEQDHELLLELANTQAFLSEEQKDMKGYVESSFLRDSLSVSRGSQILLLEKGDRMLLLKDYDMAGFYYKQSLSYVAPQNRRTGFYVYYCKMCHLYMAKGDYEQAEKYGRASLDIDLGEGTEVYKLNTWMIQATIYAQMKDRKRFEDCCTTLQRLMDQKKVDARKRSYAFLSQALGYVMLQEWHKADETLRKSDGILVEKYGKTDLGRIGGLSLWGGVLKKIGDYKKACEIYAECAELTRNESGENSIAYSQALEKLALAQWDAGDAERASHICTQALDVLQENIKSQLRFVPSAEREAFWNENSALLWNMSAYALKVSATNNAFTESCYDALLFSKSLLLETEKSQYEMLRQEGNPEDLEKFAEMTALQEKIADLQRDYEHNKDTLGLLHDRLRGMDQELALRSRAYSDYTKFLNCGYQQIRHCLKDKELLIDFVDYESANGNRQYAAYLIRKNQKYPLLLRLFTQNDLDRLLRGQTADVLYSPEKSAEMLALLWKQIRPYASEGSTVYYVPSGKIYQMALESFITSDGCLLGEGYRFVRLSSAREIIRQDAGREQSDYAVLYGGLQYDMSPDDMLTEHRKYSFSGKEQMRHTLRGGSVFVFLPESEKEVRQISEILKENHFQVLLRTGKSGTEESFLDFSGHSPRLLHVATHGFYYTPEEASQNKYLQGFQDAMYLSGLVLSGGNMVWQGKKIPDGVLDGILTAQDISKLDLSGTELVVLSACKSGHGKVTSEGLYGLQRAFKKAGVQSLMMTLWPISDRVTREFMVEFYKNLVRKNTSRRQAFDKAKSEIRSRYPEPFYWAGFILID